MRRSSVDQARARDLHDAGVALALKLRTLGRSREPLSARFGRQPRLPVWVLRGATVGLKDGSRVYERPEKIIAAWSAVSGLWCEDRVGIRETSFGKRLF